MRFHMLLAIVLLLAACPSGSPPSTVRMPEGVREHVYVMDVAPTDDDSYVVIVDRARFLTGDIPDGQLDGFKWYVGGNLPLA